jgi:hypothetical protein
VGIGYKHIHLIGPAFLFQAMTGLALAVLLVAVRRLLLVLAGLLFGAGSVTALLLSATVGFLGLHDGLGVPWAGWSLGSRQVGADEHNHPGDSEPDPAYAGVLATTAVPGPALIAWFDQQLTARGYRPAGYYRPSDQDTGAAWTIPHSREQIQVGVYTPSAGQSIAGSTTYEELLVSYRVTGPPPA